MFRYWIVFVVLFSSSLCFATEVTDLYRAKADLASQSQDDKDAAIRVAMEKVLVKVAGNRLLLSKPSIQKELDRHGRYTTQFNFSRENGVNKLVAVFNENKIKQLFTEQNIPLWGSLRPRVLLWIVNDNGMSRSIVSETEVSNLQLTAKSVSEEKGLPIVLPLMDLTDAQNVQTSDLWGRFIRPINKASKRYSPESIAIVRLSQRASVGVKSLKSVDWYMFNSKAQQVQAGKQFKGEDEAELLNKAITNITETMASKYALSSTTNEELKIEVTGIETLTQYVELNRFLDKLSAINHIKLLKVDGTTRRFQLSYMGSQEALFTTLGLNNHLTLLKPALPEKPKTTDALISGSFEEEYIPVFIWGTEKRGAE